MPSPDWFGFSDPAVPRNLTPPAGMEGVHTDGYSWARQGDRRENTTWISPAQWNRIIAQMRGLLTDVGIDLSDLPVNSPLLLREFIARYAAAKIIELLSGTDVGGYGVMFKNDYDPADSGIIPLAHGGTGVAASDAADLREQLGIADAIDEAVSAGLAAIRDGVSTDWDTLLEIAAGLSGKSNVGHGHAIADVTGLQAAIDGKAPISAVASAGTVQSFASNSAPTGWLKANGATISRTTYADLFAAIGTTFGAGDGSTTFAIPDLRGEFVRGWDDGRGVDSARALGSAQGHQFQTHTHFANQRSGTIGTQMGDGFQIGSVSATAGGAPASGTTGSETRPRNVALLYCIKF